MLSANVALDKLLYASVVISEHVKFAAAVTCGSEGPPSRFNAAAAKASWEHAGHVAAPSSGGHRSLQVEVNLLGKGEVNIVNY